MGRLFSLRTCPFLTPGLVSFVLASTPSSIRQFVTEAYSLMNELPIEVQKVIRKHEYFLLLRLNLFDKLLNRLQIRVVLRLINFAKEMDNLKYR